MWIQWLWLLVTHVHAVAVVDTRDRNEKFLCKVENLIVKTFGEINPAKNPETKAVPIAFSKSLKSLRSLFSEPSPAEQKGYSVEKVGSIVCDIAIAAMQASREDGVSSEKWQLIASFLTELDSLHQAWRSNVGVKRASAPEEHQGHGQGLGFEQPGQRPHTDTVLVAVLKEAGHSLERTVEGALGALGRALAAASASWLRLADRCLHYATAWVVMLASSTLFGVYLRSGASCACPARADAGGAVLASAFSFWHWNWRWAAVAALVLAVTAYRYVARHPRAVARLGPPGARSQGIISVGNR